MAFSEQRRNIPQNDLRVVSRAPGLEVIRATAWPPWEAAGRPQERALGAEWSQPRPQVRRGATRRSGHEGVDAKEG